MESSYEKFAPIIGWNLGLKDKPSPDKPFRLIYVDAFAGSGFWTPRSRRSPDDPAEFREMWRGSAAIALEVDNKPFDRLVFIEKSEERCKSLKQLRREHAGREVNVIRDDANIAIPRFCSTMRSNERAVVFLDPFATQVSWSTVKTLAGTKKVDCWDSLSTECDLPNDARQAGA